VIAAIIFKKKSDLQKARISFFFRDLFRADLALPLALLISRKSC